MPVQIYIFLMLPFVATNLFILLVMLLAGQGIISRSSHMKSRIVPAAKVQLPS